MNKGKLGIIFGLIIFVAVLLLIVAGSLGDNKLNGRCMVVYEKGNQQEGIQVNCPSGYTVTGGGFKDASNKDDDQDWNEPRNNGWFCREDKSSNNSECYAVCCSQDLIETEIISKQGRQDKGGIFVSCGDDVMVGGGFGGEDKNDDDQDQSRPIYNGWFCAEDNSIEQAECHAVCASPFENYELNCQNIEITGSLKNGVQVNCPEDYAVTGGGWDDRAGNDDDQDASYPLNNGWYCQEDSSSSNSKCYARCCKLSFWGECQIDDDCGQEDLINNYCNGSGVWSNYSIPTCVLGECGVNYEQRFNESCEFGCEDGECLPPPEGVHDVALTNFSGSVGGIKITNENGTGNLDVLTCNQRYRVYINATNLGDFYENVSFDGEVDSLFFNHNSISNFAPGDSSLKYRTLNFSLDAGIYDISVEAVVDVDDNLENNIASREVEIVCEEEEECTDNDGDGFAVEGEECGEIDCDDSNPEVHPGAEEVCNNIDDDCNQEIDENIEDIVTDMYGYDDIGECRVQIESCINGEFEIVQEAIGPEDEICDNQLDDDCDLDVDCEDDDCEEENVCIGEIECYEDSDCGLDGCAGQPNFCLFGDVYQDFIFFTCNNPGTTQSYCSNETLPFKLNDCEFGCEDGFCIEEGECSLEITRTPDAQGAGDCLPGIKNKTDIRFDWLADDCISFFDVFVEINGNNIFNLTTNVSSIIINFTDGDSARIKVRANENERVGDWSNFSNSIIIDLDESECLQECSIDEECDDGLYCNGVESCVNNSCVSGEIIDCSSNNLPEIATCNNNPDNNPFTFDIFPGFVSNCNEVSDSCSSGTLNLTHTLEIGKCGVECLHDSDCEEDEECEDYECEEENGGGGGGDNSFDYCGNLICEIEENELTCPRDCKINEINNTIKLKFSDGIVRNNNTIVLTKNLVEEEKEKGILVIFLLLFLNLLLIVLIFYFLVKKR